MKAEEDEYYFLTEKLEEINWALDGKCNDIDCDHYMYKELLKKNVKFVLEHNFSCVETLKKEKKALLRILSHKKYYRLRYVVCDVCKKRVDSLSNEYDIVMFTKPEGENYRVESQKGHKKCRPKIKVPDGWKKL